MKLTRRSVAKVLAAVAVIPSGDAPSSALPVTPHALGKCPVGPGMAQGDMCWDCYEVMTEEYDQAIVPIVERSMEAFWASLQRELPFFQRPKSDSLEFYSSLPEMVAAESFDSWQKTAEAAKIRAKLFQNKARVEVKIELRWEANDGNYS